VSLSELVGRDIAQYMHELRFEFQTHHLFILKCEFLVTRLLEEKK